MRTIPNKAVASVAAGVALALAGLAHANHHLTDGEVRRVDREQGRITLRHAEIKALDMPAMTMVFSVRDKALLDRVNAGDRVRFAAVNESGKFTVTEIQVAP
jgi:Cu(I)/Ag(I) efflux system protein CusF